MTLDRGLVALARKAVAAKPRHYVTVHDLLAVVQQESHGMPYFTDTKPGSIYSLNVAAAITYHKKVRARNSLGQPLVDEKGNPVFVRKAFNTGLTQRDILKAIIIPEQIGSFRPSKTLVGQKAKFRFEYGYWERFSNIADPIQRFRMASSWGMVQFMGPNISGKLAGEEADLFIQRFAADLDMQLLYGAGLLDELLVRARGSMDHAYRGYNSGDVNSDNPDVIARAKNVAKQAVIYESELRQRST